MSRIVAVALSLATVAAATATLGVWGVTVPALGVLVVGVLLLALLAYAGPPRVPTAPPPRALPPDRLQQDVAQLATTVDLARHGPRWADTTLRPELSRVADALLLRRTGRGLDDADTARAVLGDELWDLVDPARSLRGHDDGHGIPAAQVRRMLDRLEELA